MNIWCKHVHRQLGIIELLLFIFLKLSQNNLGSPENRLRAILLHTIESCGFFNIIRTTEVYNNIMKLDLELFTSTHKASNSGIILNSLRPTMIAWYHGYGVIKFRYMSTYWLKRGLPDVPQSLCSPISMFPSLYVPRFYVPRSLCSPVLCSPVPMFPNPYVPQYLCSPIPIFPGTSLSSPSFIFLGGKVGMRSVGTICWQNWSSFLFQDGRHCHLRKLILFTFRQKEVCI